MPHRDCIEFGEIRIRCPLDGDCPLALPKVVKAEGPVVAAKVVPLRLTAGQLAVVREIAAGKTSKQVAAVLGISTGTVEGHLHLARKRAGCLTTAELVARAVRSGLI